MLESHLPLIGTPWGWHRRCRLALSQAQLPSPPHYRTGPAAADFPGASVLLPKKSRTALWLKRPPHYCYRCSCYHTCCCGPSRHWLHHEEDQGLLIIQGFLSFYFLSFPLPFIFSWEKKKGFIVPLLQVMFLINNRFSVNTYSD